MASFGVTRRSAIGAAAALLAATGRAAAKDVTLLNVSYDPTRELYREIDPAFVAIWQNRSGDHLTINQSHGGSGAQSRAVLEGLQADVVTLALAADIDVLARHGLLARDWQKRLPDNSCPYTSTIVFLVRKGNPKHIRDWSDLIRPGISVITPNPKTSGGARWNFLAALAWAEHRPGATAATAEAYMRALFHHVPVLDIGARGATNTFVQRELGDVLLAWENEAWLARKEFGADTFEIVYPSLSILAEPPVAVADSVVDRRGTRDAATAYLQFLYTKQGQTIIGKHYYRPRDPAVAAQYAERYPAVKMVTIQDFGGWDAAQAKYFADGGMFDRIFTPGQ
ncbi:MAG TPA: sulfate ABC transporter substrate-binding protein [Acetobacteraceae bacterium]|nr:sulfate ABC transporter substrate-binding protein [Acetobacteraceae bacterium]